VEHGVDVAEDLFRLRLGAVALGEAQEEIWRQVGHRRGATLASLSLGGEIKREEGAHAVRGDRFVPDERDLAKG
jgi:hypothetical protein